MYIYIKASIKTYIIHTCTLDPAVIAQLAKCVGPEEFCLTQIIAGSNSMLPQCFVAIVRDIF